MFAVLSPYAFSICNTSGPEYEAYQYGGIARQLKPSSSLVKFVSQQNVHNLCLCTACVYVAGKIQSQVGSVINLG